MDAKAFHQLAEIIRAEIEKVNTIFRIAIPHKMCLAITLHFLSTCDLFSSMKTSFRVGYSTLSSIIEETCNAICNKLGAVTISLANTRLKWEEIETDFSNKWQMPNCIGAIDGKHIDIEAVHNSCAYYFNYKKINRKVYANRKFIYIDVGCNGMISDGGVFGKTTLHSFRRQIKPAEYSSSESIT